MIEFNRKGDVKKRRGKNYPIGHLLSRVPVQGDIGIEIECEGNKFPKGTSTIATYWKYTKDGSLRGMDNAEYVLKSPIGFNNVEKAVKKLDSYLKEFGTKLDESNRTSVHVHLNVQNFHLNRLAAFLGMFFPLEEVLTEWCGDHRVGNLFCLRGKDAPAIVSGFRKFIERDGCYQLEQNFHYAGVNGNALHKFGSVEFRFLRGCTDFSEIITWCKILQRMYEFSAEFPDPRTLVDSFSGQGPLAFMDMILGEYSPIVRNQVAWDNQRIMSSLYDGIRLAQDICYCRDWEEYNPVRVSIDPFGRVKPAEYVSSPVSPLDFAQAFTTTISHPTISHPAPELDDDDSEFDPSEYDPSEYDPDEEF